MGLPPLIRPARADDAPQIIPILRQWADGRAPANPGLWGREARLDGLGEPLPGMLLPVPPIYAGALGQLGLMQDDCGVTGDAPDGPARALLSAMESALRDAGAGALIGSSTQAGGWREVLAQGGYAPLTMFMGKAGLQPAVALAPVRKATVEDVPGIVAAGAASLARRGFGAALVVGPADWAGKAAVIAAQGFGTAKLRMIRQPSSGRS